MCVCVCVCVCAVGKMAKDIGMTIRKSIVWLLFWHSIPMFFHFLKGFCFCCFFGGEKTMIVVVAQLQFAPT